MTQTNKQPKKVALVTGAARRIGAAIVKRLHAANFRVVIHCYQSLKEAQVLAEELNQQSSESVIILCKNLDAPNAANEIIEKTLIWGKRLDLLVNNASVFNQSDLTSFNDDLWEDLFKINVKLPFLLSLQARSHLAKHRGVIINLADIHATKPLRNYAVYCQTKAALVMQTKALAKEFAPEIRVNAIAPGAILWPEHKNKLSSAIQKKIIAKTPLKCHGNPDYIAQALLALVENPFITGQILNVDGGRSTL